MTQGQSLYFISVVFAAAASQNVTIPVTLVLFTEHFSLKELVLEGGQREGFLGQGSFSPGKGVRGHTIP